MLRYIFLAGLLGVSSLIFSQDSLIIKQIKAPVPIKPLENSSENIDNMFYQNSIKVRDVEISDEISPLGGTLENIDNWITELNMFPGIRVEKSLQVAGGVIRIFTYNDLEVISAQPLIFVNGIPQEESGRQSVAGLNGYRSTPLLDIPAGDISKIIILTGLEATNFYGDQGKNGVIQIFTRAGANADKKIQVEAYSELTYSTTNRLPERQATYGSGQPFFAHDTEDPLLSIYNWGEKIQNLVHLNNSPSTTYDQGVLLSRDSAESLGANYTPAQLYDPTNYFETVAQRNSHLAISGKLGSTHYFVSMRNLQGAGLVKRNQIARNSINGGIHSRLSDKLEAGLNAMFIRNNDQPFNSHEYASSVLIAPSLMNLNNYENSDQVPYRYGSFYSPYYYDNTLIADSENDRLNTNAYINYRINSWFDLNLESGYGEYKSSGKRIFNTPFEQETTTQSENYQNWNTQLRSSGEGTVGSHFKLGYTGGLRFQNVGKRENYSKTTSESQAFSKLKHDYHRLAALGSIGISFKGMLQYYGWVYSDLTGAHDLSFTNHLTFHVMDVLDKTPKWLNGLDVFASHTRFIDRDAQVTMPRTLIYQIQESDSTIRHEIKTGITISSFRSRLKLKYEYAYLQHSNAQSYLTNILNPFYDALQTGIADFSNQAHLISLYSKPINGEKFKWELTGSLWSSKKVAKSLADGLPRLTYFDNGRVGVYFNEGEELTLSANDLLKDANGNLIIQHFPSQPHYHGQPIVDFDSPVQYKVAPKFISNFNNKLTYNQFSLSCHIEWKHGGHAYNYLQQQLDIYGLSKQSENRGTAILEGVKGEYVNNELVVLGTNDIEIDKGFNYYNAIYNASNLYVQRTDWVRLRNLQVNYELPQKICQKLKLTSANIYASINNVLIWTPFEGQDPAVLDLGTGINVYDSSNFYNRRPYASQNNFLPNVSSWNVGLKIGL